MASACRLSERDYVHVSDIADAHVLALDYLLKEGRSCALNLANSRGYSIKEVIAVAETVSGRTVPVEIVGCRPGEPPILVGNDGLARAVLGWRPSVPIWTHRYNTRGTG